MKFEKYTGEPCGVGRVVGIDPWQYPDEVLWPEDAFGNVPMCVSLSLDKKRLLLIDNVDHCDFNSLSKDEALVLAAEFKAIADEME